MSPPAVIRAVAGREERLGVRLLNRTTRYARTADAGQRYLDDTRRILVEVDAADAAATGDNVEPRGHLAVTAPALFGRKFVMPGIVEYLKRYPETGYTLQRSGRSSTDGRAVAPVQVRLEQSRGNVCVETEPERHRNACRAGAANRPRIYGG